MALPESPMQTIIALSSDSTPHVQSGENSTESPFFVDSHFYSSVNSYFHSNYISLVPVSPTSVNSRFNSDCISPTSLNFRTNPCYSTLMSVNSRHHPEYIILADSNPASPLSGGKGRRNPRVADTSHIEV